MRYLSGCVYQPCLQWIHGGAMLTPEMGNNPDLSGVFWAADNGCYTAGDKFSEKKWLRFLEKHQGKGHCFFVVAPDVPFDMKATLERSVPYLQTIREIGYPSGLAIQNGVTLSMIDWESIDAVFIAGDKAFKTSQIALQVIGVAKVKGKHVHIARRNSKRAMQEAYDMGADTVDGTFLAYGPDQNFPRMQRWFDSFCQHEAFNAWDNRHATCKKCKRQFRYDIAQNLLTS